MNRRGVTLLELLLAIALLLAVGGLVLPALFDRLTERAFESSAEIVRSQLLLARAHAQATGEPIEVLFATDPPRVAARRFDASLVTLEPRADASDGQDEPFEVTSLDDHKGQTQSRQSGVRQHIADQRPTAQHAETTHDSRHADHAYAGHRGSGKGANARPRWTATVGGHPAREDTWKAISEGC